MDGQFPQFRKLPQEIQDKIWEKNMLSPTPCMQAVGLCGFEETSEQVNTQPANNHHFVRQADRLRILLPDPVLMRRSPYYHTLAQAAPVCQAAYKAFVRVLRERGGTEITAVGPQVDAALTIKIGEKKTMAWTIVAAKGRLTEEDKKMEHHGGHVPDAIIASRDPCNNIIPIFINPAVDILLLDFPFRTDPVTSSRSWLATSLEFFGSYEPNLMPLQQLAIEFDSRFGMVCSYCDHLSFKRQNYQEWLEIGLKSPRETSSTDGPSDRRIVCLFCTALGRPEPADLSAAERKKARDWLKFKRTRELIKGVGAIAGTEDDRMIQNLIKRYVRHYAVDSNNPPFDIKAFLSAQLLLRRVTAVVHSIETTLRHDNNVATLEACLADFDGDTVALYNNVAVDGNMYHSYCPEHADEASGLPICLAGQEGDHYHSRVWCRNTKAAASFWPMTTPNLQTMYVIDRGIKLKLGACIPPGTPTFKGNNCLYAEVPRPVCRSLKQGGEDAVWQYPAARSWGAEVFGFARRMYKIMATKQGRLRGRGYNSIYDLDDPLRKEEADADYKRAVRDGKVPECRVLAILEE